MHTVVIKNGKCITPYKIIDDAVVAFEDKRITYVGSKSEYTVPSNALIIDAKNNFISPGFIDLQINGGGGSDSLDGTVDAFNEIIKFHSKYGVTNLLLTLVSSNPTKILEVLKSVVRFKQEESWGTFVLGVHLEGPYISPDQPGAHNQRFIREPEKGEYKKYLEYSNVIKLITLAPEVPGVLKFSRKLIDRGIIASIGHSNAIYEDVLKAVESGFSMVTHIYSGMSSMRRINLAKVAGVLESALLLDDLYVEVIGDGLHVPEPLFKLVLKNKGVSRLILTTDAIRAAGLEDGVYFLGGKEDRHKIVVKGGIAMTSNRKLYAGSTCTMDKCVKNAMILGALDLPEAVQMATINPAKLLKIDREVGSLEKGKKADILIFDREVHVYSVIKDGNLIYDIEKRIINK